MTFFGQFFDHGLDLVTKGGNGTIFIPLQPDDPLYVPGQRRTNFMVLTRATNRCPGPDGILGTADDIHEHENTTTPFVDQNQTYTSHPSHQVFLRAYMLDADGHPLATGKLITNATWAPTAIRHRRRRRIGGMATWGDVKAQARDILGINLTDADVFDVPLLATDAYGNFIKGAHGLPQVVIDAAPTASPNTDGRRPGRRQPRRPDQPGPTRSRTGHQFLDRHRAQCRAGLDRRRPRSRHRHRSPAMPTARSHAGRQHRYDNELLDAHYIAGDGRVNENIGLTAVHSIFHSEHNRLVEQTKQRHPADRATCAFLNEWLLDLTQVAGDASRPTPAADRRDLQWNGERLFQAAKFGTEMQYQHLVFEEFARTIQPHDRRVPRADRLRRDIDPAIVAEFAHTVYRFGHSMLTETARSPASMPTSTSSPIRCRRQSTSIGLIAAFLNPLAFAASGPTPMSRRPAPSCAA